MRDGSRLLDASDITVAVWRALVEPLAERRRSALWRFQQGSVYPSTANVWQTLNIGKAPGFPNNLNSSGAVHGQMSRHCLGVVWQTLPVLRYRCFCQLPTQATKRTRAHLKRVALLRQRPSRRQTQTDKGAPGARRAAAAAAKQTTNTNTHGQARTSSASRCCGSGHADDKHKHTRTSAHLKRVALLRQRPRRRQTQTHTGKRAPGAVDTQRSGCRHVRR